MTSSMTSPLNQNSLVKFSCFKVIWTDGSSLWSFCNLKRGQLETVPGARMGLPTLIIQATEFPWKPCSKMAEHYGNTVIIAEKVLFAAPGVRTSSWALMA